MKTTKAKKLARTVRPLDATQLKAVVAGAVDAFIYFKESSPPTP
jgi:hypothetical protein